jgi:quercetin dioxygenase-like cupin family protein
VLVERYSVAGRQPELRSGTFTGRAWLERVLTAEGVGVNSVFFEPGSRTYWHRHGGGQLLLVSSGQGLVATRAGDGRVVRPGDVVHAPSGEEHWHGASPGAYLAHTAISLGEVEWLEEVDPAQYQATWDAASAAER